MLISTKKTQICLIDFVFFDYLLNISAIIVVNILLTPYISHSSHCKVKVSRQLKQKTIKQLGKTSIRNRIQEHFFERKCTKLKNNFV